MYDVNFRWLDVQKKFFRTKLEQRRRVGKILYYGLPFLSKKGYCRCIGLIPFVVKGG